MQPDAEWNEAAFKGQPHSMPNMYALRQMSLTGLIADSLQMPGRGVNVTGSWFSSLLALTPRSTDFRGDARQSHAE